MRKVLGNGRRVKILIRMCLLRRLRSYQVSTASSTLAHGHLISTLAPSPPKQHLTGDAITQRSNRRHPETAPNTLRSTRRPGLDRPTTSRRNNHASLFPVKAGPDTLHQSQLATLQHVLLVQTRLLLQARDVRIRPLLLGSQPRADTLQEEEYLADD